MTDSAVSKYKQSRGRDLAALIALTLSPVFAEAFWVSGLLVLGAGILLVIRSNAWSVGQKVAAVFLLPSALAFIAGPLIAGVFTGSQRCYSFSSGPMHCTTSNPGPNFAYLGVAALGGVALAALLVWLLRRSNARA